MTNNMQYPTEWKYGIPKGTYKKFTTSRMIVISPPHEKQITKTFSYRNYGSKELAIEASEKWKKEKSDELGLTENRIRYLDADTIEIKLTQGKKMTTDAQFLDIFLRLFENGTTLKCDTKKGKNDRHYARYKTDKTHNVSDLLCNYKIVDYIDGNSLNLRSSNMKEFGSVINKNTKNIKEGSEIKESTLEKDAEKQADYFEMEFENLPKGKWLLGKAFGTVFPRGGTNVYTVVVKDEKKKPHSKTFNMADYKNKKHAKKNARRWQRITSYKLNMTKCMIKILDNSTIGVQLTEDKIMLTDRIFIPLIQKIPVFVATNNKGVDYVAYSYFDKNNKSVTRKFHNLITGFSMVDHINGNTLDNRLCNLEMTTASLNNSNRHDNGKKICPVKPRTIINAKGKQYMVYISRVKLDKVTYFKEFSTNMYGKNAKKLAEQFSKDIRDDDVFETSQFCDVPNFCKYKIEKFNKIKNLIKDNMVTKSKDYLPTVAMSDNLRKTLFMYYTIHYNKKYMEYQKKLQNITNKRYEMIT